MHELKWWKLNAKRSCLPHLSWPKPQIKNPNKSAKAMEWDKKVFGLIKYKLHLTSYDYWGGNQTFSARKEPTIF